MNKVFTALAAGFVALSAPTLALAQATDPDAVAQAASQQACGEASVIRTIFLDDERIQVTCRGAVGTNPSALGGRGLTPPPRSLRVWPRFSSLRLLPVMTTTARRQPPTNLVGA